MSVSPAERGEYPEGGGITRAPSGGEAHWRAAVETD
jgi:hypothetical protein